MQTKNYLLLLILVCIAIFIPHLNVIEVNIMEARNFITAREMLQHGNWIHTTMNLEPRYEKPPLPTWLTAISASVFGVKNLFGLRLPAVLSVIFLIITFYFFVTSLLKEKKHAFFSALILSTSFYIVFSGRNGQWDIFAHAFMVFAIYQLFYIFQSKNSARWKNWILAGIFMGLSFMSKGPVSHFALLLPFLISYGFIFKYKNFKSKFTPLFVSVCIFLVVGLSWGIFIYLTDGSSAQTIANKETTAWANRNVRPFYYYWSFFIQSGIWTVFAFISLLYPFMIKRVQNKKIYQFSFLWTISAVVLLSLIPEKKERYLLPVLIPLALNTSFYIQYIITQTKKLKKIDIYISNFAFGLVGLIGVIFPIASYIFIKENIQDYWFWYVLTSISLFSIGLGIFYFLGKRKYENCFYSFILFIMSIMVFAIPLSKSFFTNKDYASTNTLRKTEGFDKIPLYSTDLNLPAPEIIFELGEPIKRVKKIEELPQKNKFALLVRNSIPENVKSQFQYDFIKEFDENHSKKGTRGHRSRKTIKLFLLEKK